MRWNGRRWGLLLYWVSSPTTSHHCGGVINSAEISATSTPSSGPVQVVDPGESRPTDDVSNDPAICACCPLDRPLEARGGSQRVVNATICNWSQYNNTFFLNDRTWYEWALSGVSRPLVRDSRSTFFKTKHYLFKFVRETFRKGGTLGRILCVDRPGSRTPSTWFSKYDNNNKKQYLQR